LALRAKIGTQKIVEYFAAAGESGPLRGPPRKSCKLEYMSHNDGEMIAMLLRDRTVLSSSCHRQPYMPV
jgi:hypothetical protein